MDPDDLTEIRRGGHAMSIPLSDRLDAVAVRTEQIARALRYYAKATRAGAQGNELILSALLDVAEPVLSKIESFLRRPA